MTSGGPATASKKNQKKRPYIRSFPPKNPEPKGKKYEEFPWVPKNSKPAGSDEKLLESG